MLEAFDPTSARAAKTLAATLPLSAAAAGRLDSAVNVRRYVDRLLEEGLAADALLVIARALPVQLVVAWCIDCLRSGLEGAGPTFEVERAAITLAEQCLKQPTDSNRQLCLEFAERGRRATAGAWLAMAAAWADGNLAPPASGVKVPAPPEVVADTVMASLQLAAAASGAAATERMHAYAGRALAAFGPRAMDA